MRVNGCESRRSLKVNSQLSQCWRPITIVNGLWMKRRIKVNGQEVWKWTVLESEWSKRVKLNGPQILKSESGRSWSSLWNLTAQIQSFYMTVQFNLNCLNPVDRPLWPKCYKNRMGSKRWIFNENIPIQNKRLISWWATANNQLQSSSWSNWFYPIETSRRLFLLLRRRMLGSKSDSFIRLNHYSEKFSDSTTEISQTRFSPHCVGKHTRRSLLIVAVSFNKALNR